MGKQKWVVSICRESPCINGGLQTDISASSPPFGEAFGLRLKNLLARTSLYRK